MSDAPESLHFQSFLKGVGLAVVAALGITYGFNQSLTDDIKDERDQCLLQKEEVQARLDEEHGQLAECEGRCPVTAKASILADLINGTRQPFNKAVIQ